METIFCSHLKHTITAQCLLKQGSNDSAIKDHRFLLELQNCTNNGYYRVTKLKGNNIMNGTEGGRESLVLYGLYQYITLRVQGWVLQQYKEGRKGNLNGPTRTYWISVYIGVQYYDCGNCGCRKGKNGFKETIAEGIQCSMQALPRPLGKQSKEQTDRPRIGRPQINMMSSNGSLDKRRHVHE